MYPPHLRSIFVYRIFYMIFPGGKFNTNTCSQPTRRWPQQVDMVDMSIGFDVEFHPYSQFLRSGVAHPGQHGRKYMFSYSVGVAKKKENQGPVEGRMGGERGLECTVVTHQLPLEPS